MKSYAFYLSICLVLLRTTTLFAQPKTFTVNGKTDQSEKFLLILRNNGPLEYNNYYDSLPISSAGKFNMKIKMEDYEVVRLLNNGKAYNLFVQPGSSLRLNIKDSVVSFAGPMGKYANYYLDQRINDAAIFEKYSENNAGMSALLNYNPKKYFLIQDSILAEQNTFLDHYFANISEPSKVEFIRREKSLALYSDLYYKIQSSNTAYKEFAFFQRELNLPPVPCFDFSDEVTFDDKKLFALWSYKSFVQSALPPISKKILLDRQSTFEFGAWIDIQMELIDKWSKDPYCNFYNKAIILDFWVTQIKHNGILAWSDKLYALTKELQPMDNEMVLEDIKKNLDKIVLSTKFKKGAAAPGFTFIDSSGKKYDLEDFRGKKIYIDIWATWCAPCIALQPELEKRIAEYADNEKVIFISVAIDDKPDAWVKFLRKSKLNGLQLYSGEGLWKSQFAKDYEIFSLPWFIIIDESGNIASYPAPRPDNPTELEMLLQ